MDEEMLHAVAAFNRAERRPDVVAAVKSIQRAELCRAIEEYVERYQASPYVNLLRRVALLNIGRVEDVGDEKFLAYVERRVGSVVELGDALTAVAEFDKAQTSARVHGTARAASTDKPQDVETREGP
jgi:hypothetical protein